MDKFPEDSIFYEHEDLFEEVAMDPEVKQYLDLKKRHPDAILLFRMGDFYITYKEDAEKTEKVLKTILYRSASTKDEIGLPLKKTMFPYHALDVYLPRLIRAGYRVAICESINNK